MTDHRRATVLIGGGAGAVDKIDGAGLSAGDTIQCINSTGIYTYINVQDSAAESIPDVIRPDTNPGTNSWHLFNWLPPMSHVEATRESAQSIADSSATEIIIFNLELKDVLGEYVHTTGIFTATHNGFYVVNSGVGFVSASWDAQEFSVLNLAKNNAVYRRGGRKNVYATTTFNMTPVFSGGIYLLATETIDIRCFQNQGGALNLDATAGFNWLTIDRLM